MKPIGVIFNPFAYINKKRTVEQLNAIREILGANALVRATNSTDEIPIILKEFHKEEIKILCISGGDGTIGYVLSSYINLFGTEDLPIIVPLKGGTMNMLSGDVGLTDDQITVCRKLIQYIESKDKFSTIERGLIRIIDPRFKYHNYAFCWLDGLPYRVMKSYYREGATVEVALKLIFKAGIISLIDLNHELFKEVESKVYVDDKEMPFKSHLFIVASSVKRLIFGFRIFSEEAEVGERFSMVYVRLPYFKKIRYQLPWALYIGLKSDASGNFLNQSTRSVRIEGNKGYIIDGEVYESEEPVDIKLEAGPKVKILSFKSPDLT
jgi:diacylglycerol kinase (ATP)